MRYIVKIFTEEQIDTVAPNEDPSFKACLKIQQLPIFLGVENGIIMSLSGIPDGAFLLFDEWELVQAMQIGT